EQVATLYAELTAALRGYLVTGDEAMLEPYGPKMDDLRLLLSELEESVAGDTEQVGRVHQLQQLIETWRIQVAEPEIAMMRQGSSEVGILLMNDGVSYTERINKYRDDFIHAETVRMDQDVARARLASDQVVRITWLAISLAAALALGGFLVFARGVTRSTAALADAA